MNKPTHWTITLEAAEDGSGDLVLPLTDEIMESAGWKTGDTLEWMQRINELEYENSNLKDEIKQLKWSLQEHD